MRQVPWMFCLMFASVGAFGGCDDALDNPPQGIVALRVDVRGAMQCPIIGSYALPAESELLRTPAEASVEGFPRIVQGDDGAQVECLVRETAPSAYTVNAKLSQKNSAFAIKGSVADAVGTNLDVSWVSPNSAGAYSGGVCTATVDEQRANGGAIRLSFECPLFDDTTRPTIGCTASGSVVLERCDE